MTRNYLVEYQQIGSNADRDRVRPEHIAYRKGIGRGLLLAGPLLDDNDNPIGSVVILTADTKVQAEEVAAADPYVANRIFTVASVRAMRIAAMQPPLEQ